MKKLKDEEIKKMREERLERIRNENPEPQATFPQMNGFKFSLQKQNSHGNNGQSPKFQNDAGDLKTLSGLTTLGYEEDQYLDNLPGLNKQVTAKFPGRKFLATEILIRYRE